MTNRRTFLGALAATLSRAAGRLPANENVKWAVSSALWSHFPPVKFTEILDVMRDTGFIGVRVTSFPGILKHWGTTQAEMEREVSRRNLHVVTISFNAPVYDAALHAKCVASARQAMQFLSGFGANRLVVFSPSRRSPGADTEAGFRAMCDGFNKIGEAASGMGFQAGLHNHMGQMAQTPQEIDRVMTLTDPALFHFSPDTAHLYLAGSDVPKTLGKYRARVMFLDYKDARWTMPEADLTEPNGKTHPKDSSEAKFLESIYDLGDGAIDFPACHRVLKSMSYKGWICVDLDRARHGPRASYERCGEYVVRKLEPIYK
ncbi:MAG: TIM barrel protein [Bryobacteraceae bacterium]